MDIHQSPDIPVRLQNVQAFKAFFNACMSFLITLCLVQPLSHFLHQALVFAKGWAVFQ